MKSIEKINVEQLSTKELIKINGGGLPWYIKWSPVGLAVYVIDEICSGISEGLLTDCKDYDKPSSPYNN